MKLRRVLALLLLLGPSLPAAEAVMDRDTFFRELKKVTEDRGNFEPLLEIADRQKEPEWRAHLLRQRGVVYLHQTAWEDARNDFLESAGIYDELGMVAEAARSRLRRVSMLSRSDPPRAITMYEEIEASLMAIDDEAVLYEAQVIRERMRVDSGDYLGALPGLTDLAQYFKGQEKKKRLSDVLSLQSYALQQLNRWEASRDSYRALIDASFESRNQALLAYAYCNLGDVERELGQPEVAETNLDRAMELLDGIRSRLPGGVDERMTFLDAQVSAYDRKISLRVDERDPIGGLKVAERFHATSLLEELAASAPPGRDALTPEQRETLDQLIELQRKLISKGLDETEGTRLRELERRWESLGRSERRLAEKTIPQVQPRAPSEVQAALPASTAMLAYWVHPQRTFLWVLTAERIDLIQIPVGRETLSESVDRYLEPIRDRVRAEDLALRGKEREHLQLGAELYDLLIEPALRRLAGIEHLIIVPDDRLWHLPFEALVRDVGEDPDEADPVWFARYARAGYLLEDFSVLYTPSASVWVELAQRDTARKGLIAVAPSLSGAAAARERGWSLAPLPGAAEEAKSVAAMARPGRALLGSDATEGAIKSALSRYRFVHFATHGYLHRERPHLSGLFLWPDGEDDKDEKADGLFQGFEVRELPLQAELVSLAACNSGLGQLSRAEGIIGMARAFLVAGSRNVLVSMWPVDDRASGSLVRRFYGELQGFGTLPRALRQAKLALLDETTEETVVTGKERVAYAHPYFWATYVLIGGDALERASVDPEARP